MIDYLNAYLNEDKLEKTCSLFEIGNINFHWSDCKDAIIYRRKLILEDGKLDAMDELHHEVTMFKERTIWLSIKGEIITSNLYDVFEMFVSNQQTLPVYLYDDELFFSLEGRDSEFKHFKSKNWSKTADFQKFLYYYLLTDQIGRRKFRIRADGGIMLFTSAKKTESSVVLLRQLTLEGMIISSSDVNFLKSVLDANKVSIYLNTGLFQLLANEKYDFFGNKDMFVMSRLLYTTDPEDEFNVNVLRVIEENRNFNGHDLFIPYEALSGEHDINEIIPKFLNRIYDSIIQATHI